MSSEFFNLKKSDTTLDVTIGPEDCPANKGTKGDYFKLEFKDGDKCIVRNDLLCSSYSSSCSSDYKTSSSRNSSCSSDSRQSSSCSSDYKTSSSDYEYSKKSKAKHLATFVQITDIHIIDGASPSRASFLAAYLPFVKAIADSFRPYEIFSTQVAETMVRRINSIKRGPHLKQKFSMVINTGDNSDSLNINELTNYINILDGGKVVPIPTDETYVGVQDNYPATSYPIYYHPDQHPESVPNDKFKVDYGYPNFQDILHSAAKSFHATGLNIPWYTGNGNHDSSKLGNYSLGFYEILTLFDEISTGKIPGLGSKLIESLSPIQAQLFLKALTLQSSKATLEVLNRTQLREVPPSEKRLQFTRADFINMHFSSTITPGPVGHGFDSRNVKDNVLYYTFDISDKVGGIMLDSCNLNGNLVDPDLAPNGSIGRIQIDWLEKELRKRHSSYYNNQGQLIKTDNKDELTLLFCHHTIDTMNNNFTSPTTFDNDPQRILGPEFVKIIHRYPNVIGILSGHTHTNKITPYPDPSGKTQGFWEITTASHIDYPQQSRIIEIGENDDDTLSIFCTVFDHLSPADVNRGCFSSGPAKNCCSSKYSSGYSSESDNSSKYESYDDTRCREKYTIEEMASISRELSYNDPFIVNKFDDAENRTGTPKDRNAELLIYNPLKRKK